MQNKNIIEDNIAYIENCQECISELRKDIEEHLQVISDIIVGKVVTYLDKEYVIDSLYTNLDGSYYMKGYQVNLISPYKITNKLIYIKSDRDNCWYGAMDCVNAPLGKVFFTDKLFNERKEYDFNVPEPPELYYRNKEHNSASVDNMTLQVRILN